MKASGTKSEKGKKDKDREKEKDKERDRERESSVRSSSSASISMVASKRKGEDTGRSSGKRYQQISIDISKKNGVEI